MSSQKQYRIYYDCYNPIRGKLPAQSRVSAKCRTVLILDRASANWQIRCFVDIKESYLRDEKFNENKE
jgi:hypothetical protein